MSWCEDYRDPFPRYCDHGVPDGINCDDCADDTMDDDEEDWECAYPGECLMPGMGHHSSECFTIEDAQEMDGGV